MKNLLNKLLNWVLKKGPSETKKEQASLKKEQAREQADLKKEQASLKKEQADPKREQVKRTKLGVDTCVEVSEEQGASEEQGVCETGNANHALITQLSRTNHPINLRCSRYAAVLFMVFVVGLGQAWGASYTWNFANKDAETITNKTKDFTSESGNKIITFDGGSSSDGIVGDAGSRYLKINGKSSFSTGTPNDRFLSFSAPSSSGTISISYNSKAADAEISAGQSGTYVKSVITSATSSTCTSSVVTGLTAGTTTVYIAFPSGSAYINSITWTDADAPTYTQSYYSEIISTTEGTALESGCGLTLGSSATLVAKPETAWLANFSNHVNLGSSSSTVTFTFSSALPLVSDGDDRGKIRIYYGSASATKGVALTVNGSATGSTYNATVATRTYVGEYTIPDGTSSVSSIVLGANNSNVKVFAIEVLTHSGGGCSDDTGLSYEETTVNKVYGDASFTNTLTNSNSLSVSYSSSNTDVATVNSSTGAVTIAGAGTTTITATWAGNATYCANAVSYTLNVKPNVGSVTGAWDRFGGETISLSVSPTGGSSYTYQWQKYVSSAWSNVSNGADGTATVSGATTNNLQISNCHKNNSGSYRCVVTAASQTNETDGRQVKVYVLECYTGGTTVYNFTRDGENQRGSVEIELSASTAYTFKVHADNDYYGNNGTVNEDVTNWVMCNNSTTACTTNLTVNSGLGGTFTFTMDYSTGGSSSVEGEPELSITYPRKTIYLNAGGSDLWDKDNAKFGIYYFRKVGETLYGHAWTDIMPAYACGSGIYVTEIPQWNGVKMNAVRLNPSATNDNKSDWWNSYKYNQTNDCPVSSNDYVTITGWEEASYTYTTYAAPTYDITFAKNGADGGSDMDDVEDIACDASVTLEANTWTKTGYTFTGWKDGSSNDYADEAAINDITADIALTAQWSPKSCTVSFDNNGGTGTITSVTATYDVAMPTKAGNLPTKTGYTFAGFFDGEGGTDNQYYKADGTSYTNWDKNTTSTTTLYAKWTVNNYTLAWDKNGSGDALSGSYTSGSTAYGTTLTAPDDPTWDGYRFTGWNTANDGSGDDFTGTMPAANTTYYAQWEEIDCPTDGTMFSLTMLSKVTGDNMSLSAPDSIDLGKDSYATVSGGKASFINYDTENGRGKITKDNPNKLQFNNNNNVALRLDFDCALQTGDSIILSGVSGCNMSFTTTTKRSDADSTSVIDGKYCFIVPDKLNGATKLYGWRSRGTSLYITGLKVTRPVAATYTVTYKANGGSDSDVVDDAATSVASNTFTAPTGKVFGGWNTKSDGTGDAYAVGDAVSSDLTLYAQWKYKVYYIGNTVGESNDITTALSSNYVVSVKTTTGTSFNASDYSDYALIVLSEKLSGSDAETSDHELRKIIEVNKPILNLKSYFYGSNRWNWGTPNAGKKPKNMYVKNDVYANLTSHPIFTDLTITSDSISVLSTVSTTKPLQPVGSFVSGKEGYTLAKVPNSDSGSGAAIHEMTASQRSTATGQSITAKYLLISIQGGELSNLSADGKKLIQNAADYLITGSQWVPQYTITYAKGSADGASGDSFTGTKTHGTSISLSSSTSAFTRSGYTYDGWSTSADGSTKDYNLGGSYTTDAAATLYPHWVLDCTDAELAYADDDVDKTFGDAAFTNTLTNSHSASVTYSSTNTSVATVESDGEVTIVGVGETTIKATLSGDATYCDDEVSYTLTVGKADLSVSPTAGTATSITHNSATLPFTLSSTSGVASVTLNVYNTSDVLVTTVDNVTAATSGSGNVTGLDAETTYYFTVTPIGDANHNDGAASSKSSTFTTEAAPTLSALVAGTLYKVEDMVPEGTTITGSDQFVDGLSENTKFFLLGTGSGSSGTTMKVKSDSRDIDDITFQNTYYFGTAATVDDNTPTNYAIKFMVPTGGGSLKVYAKGSSSIKLSKEGVAGTAIGSGGTNVYGSYTLDVTAGTWYLYATGGSTAIYGVQLLVMHDLTTTVSGGVGGIVSAPSSVAEGLTTTVTATPAKGYVVTNWAVSGTGASIDPSGASSSTTTTLTMGTTDATVTVTFGVANYSVTYDGNSPTSGSVPTDATDYHYGDEVTVKGNTGSLVKTDCTFRGWTDGDYFYKAGDKFTITDNTTLTAVWENISGEISEYIIPVLGSNSTTLSPSPSNAWVCANGWLTRDFGGSSTSSNSDTYTGVSSYRAGSNASNWMFSSVYGGSKVRIYLKGINNTATVISSVYYSTSYFSATKDATAWTASTDYTVAYYTAAGVSCDGIANGTQGYAELTLTSPMADNSCMYISTNVNTNPYAVSVFSSASPYYDVSFANMTSFAGEATLPSTIVGVQSGKKILKPTDPTTEGNYVFGGWYKEGSCTNAWDFESDEVTEDVMLYAKWVAAPYTITWKVNGETYETTKASGSVAIVLPTAPADNTLGCAHSFRGWTATNLYGASGQSVPTDLFVDAAGAPTITKDTIFYAVFGDDASVPATSFTSTFSNKSWGEESNSKWNSGKDGTNYTSDRGVKVETSASGANATTKAEYKAVTAVVVTYSTNSSAGAGSIDIKVGGTEVLGIPDLTKDGGTTDRTITYTPVSALDGKVKITVNTTTNAIYVKSVQIYHSGSFENYRCICPSLTVTPELITASTPIFITSTASKTVRSQDSLVIVGSGLQKSATLSLSGVGTKFVLKNASDTVLKTDATGAINARGFIYYTPDAGDTSDGLDSYNSFTVTDEITSETVSTKLIGRHLPADFVIVAKNGDKWYALPSNMANSDPASTRTPVEIAVDDVNNPSIAYSDDSNYYGLVGPTNNNITGGKGQYIRLTMSVGDGGTPEGPAPLFGSTSTSLGKSGTAKVTNDLSAGWWWALTQTNTSISNPEDAKYTISTPNNTNPLKLYKTSNLWGLYSYGKDVTISELRILPVSSTVGFAEAEVVAWGKNSAIVEVDAKAISAYYAIAKLPEDITSSAVTLTQTGTSVKGTGTRYNYTMNFGVGVDFSANEGKMLTLEWYDILDNLKAISNIMVPCIVAENITINKANYGTKSDWNKEVHVLPGDTVTIDASGYSGKNITIKELVIYPGARVVVQNDTLITPTLVLRNGWNRLTAEKEYNVSQLYIPSAGSVKATNAYADWYIDYDQYYPIAVPWKVATANIAYRNMTVDIDDGLTIRYYNGERRAGRVVDEAKTNWTDYTWGGTMPANLEPGIGYAITARRPAGKAFSIIRMPLSIPSAAWTKAGEQGYVSDTHKDEVTVTAWAKDDGKTPEYAKGWNFVANPYMASYEGEIAFTPDPVPGEEYDDDIAYVNIPDVDFKEFDQVATATTELKPGCGFLIQTKYDGKITFASSSRKESAPAYRREAPSMSKQKAYILLHGEEAVDQMGLIIADRYTEDYEVNADLEKLLSDGNSLRTYMQYNDLNMAYIAINSTLAQEWIPVSVRIPATGEYTYTIHHASRVSELEGLYLIDYETNEITNLIESDYVFTATAGTITDRFALNAIVGERQTPTDIDVVPGGGDLQIDQPVKFMYHDKIYIYYRGIIYDTAGKKVAERRAAL